MRKVGLKDNTLRRAVDEMAKELIDADLGGDVVKKRIALSGQGKRGGGRTIVATKKNIVGSFCSASPKMKDRLLMPMNLKHCNIWLRNIWNLTFINLNKRLKVVF